jgi:hypothetical protein
MNKMNILKHGMGYTPFFGKMAVFSRQNLRKGLFHAHKTAQCSFFRRNAAAPLQKCFFYEHYAN